MGLNALTLKAVLGLDKKEYDRGLDDAEKKASGFGAKLKSSISTTGKVIGGVTSMIGKAVAAGTTLASGVATKIGKSALDAYSNYEQLVGGVETLFKDSAKIVQDNASKAFKTAGMDANSYMELATGFSASLIQSLKGDTAKAAEITDRAIQDMSDNANKFGTDIESIKNAYQGFSKQNYTMLDNLKLGYGGTKGEMQRLIKDASKMKDIQKELNVSVKEGDLSFANIANAISVVQKNLGIAGATAEEAGSTIEGSIKALKASWQNLLVGIADDSQPFDKLVDNFVESLVTAGKNILPRVEQILGGIGRLIEKLVPEIASRIPGLVRGLLPKLLETLKSIAVSVESTLMQLINMVANFLANNGGTIINGIVQFITRIVKMLPQILQPILKQLPKIIRDVAKGLKQSLPELINGVSDLLVGLAEALPDILDALIDVLPDLINTIMDAVIDNLPVIMFALAKLMGQIAVRLPEIIGSILAVLPKIVEAVIVGLGSLAAGIFTIFEDIDLTEVIGGIVDSIGEVFSQIGEVLEEPFEAIQAFFEHVWEVIEETMDWIWNKVKGVFQDIYDFLDWINPFSDSAEERAEKARAENARKNAQAVIQNGGASDWISNTNKMIENAGIPILIPNTQKTEVSGTVRVEGVNDQGQLIGTADYTMNQLSKKLERDARMYGYGGG